MEDITMANVIEGFFYGAYSGHALNVYSPQILSPYGKDFI